MAGMPTAVAPSWEALRSLYSAAAFDEARAYDALVDKHGAMAQFAPEEALDPSLLAAWRLSAARKAKAWEALHEHVQQGR